MQVRNAETADMVEVAELARAMAAHVLDPDPGKDVGDLSTCCFGPERWFECLVAVAGTRIVGFATYGRIFEAHTRDKRLWVGDLYVRQEARRSGAGRALIAALCARAEALGCAGLTLELARGNNVARSFYERLGVTPSDQVDVMRVSTPVSGRKATGRGVLE
jgi:GNAT superfamily N-acetyltransferase